MQSHTAIRGMYIVRSAITKITSEVSLQCHLLQCSLTSNLNPVAVTMPFVDDHLSDKPSLCFSFSCFVVLGPSLPCNITNAIQTDELLSCSCVIIFKWRLLPCIRTLLRENFQYEIALVLHIEHVFASFICLFAFCSMPYELPNHGSPRERKRSEIRCVFVTWHCAWVVHACVCVIVVSQWETRAWLRSLCTWADGIYFRRNRLAALSPWTLNSATEHGLLSTCTIIECVTQSVLCRCLVWDHWYIYLSCPSPNKSTPFTY